MTRHRSPDPAPAGPGLGELRALRAIAAEGQGVMVVLSAPRDSDALLASIREKFWPLGDDVAFISGHGPMSTLGEERRSNPYCADE